MIPSHTGFRTEHVLPSRRTTDEPALSDDARQALKEASRMSPRRHVVAFAAKSRRIIRRMVPFLAAVVLVVAANLNAQSITGSISGSVRDSSSLAVAGASATLVSIATGAQRGALSDTQGDFIFAAVAPGPYLLKLQAPNHPASKVGIQLVFLTYGQIKRRDESVIVWLKVLDVPNLSTRCGDQLGE
jgi:Carboxypeptidase regulatory-like domain